MDHEIYLTLQEHHQRLTVLEEKVDGIIKATGLKEKEEQSKPDATK